MASGGPGLGSSCSCALYPGNGGQVSWHQSEQLPAAGPQLVAGQADPQLCQLGEEEGMVLSGGHEDPGQTLLRLNVGALVHVVLGRASAALGAAVGRTGSGSGSCLAQLGRDHALVLDGEQCQDLPVVHNIQDLLTNKQFQLYVHGTRLQLLEYLSPQRSQSIVVMDPELHVLHLVSTVGKSDAQSQLFAPGRPVQRYT